MDTSQIKKFAVEARNILKQGVVNRITALGFNDQGEVAERNIPQRLQGNTLFMGQLYDENFYDKWFALFNRVQTRGIKEVYEEAAYTWFNRLMAIRIMEKNGFTEPALAFDNDRLRIPRIVSNARAGQFFVEDASDREKLSELLMDDTKTTEQFTLLITSFCHSNPVINNCFGGVSEYTEILLPTNILSEGGFVDLLNHTGFISDDDYKQSELIGWLYQFYISEKKDEVFTSFKGGKKAEAEDIPAATQIFTPNWIVKYMVQNTVGRIYLDNNPNSDLKEGWKYLVEPSSPTPDDSIFKYNDPKELTMADLGCGSGHILNEGFDILYDIYIEEGYSRKQAVENIFKYNLTGVDLDTRAKQLATFALMMKACQKDDSFLDCHVMPNVLDMPDIIVTDGLLSFMINICTEDIYKSVLAPIARAFILMEQAHNLGSVMKFEFKNEDDVLKVIKDALHYCEEIKNPELVEVEKGLRLILALTKKYAAVVMNPPYMGSSNMNAELSSYVQKNYIEGKSDLFSTFMMVAVDRLENYGKYGMINMHSWMFLSSFETLRRNLLKNYHIDNMLHLGPRTFDELSGEVVQNTTYVISKYTPLGNFGNYYRLVDGKNCVDKERMFLEAQTNHTNKVYYPDVSQRNFEKIPGWLFGYWLSSAFLETFDRGKALRVIANVPKGLSTGCVERFMREWFEVNNKKIDFESHSCQESAQRNYKWFPYAKGGSFRRWNGNLEFVVNWENDGDEVKNFVDEKGKQRSRPQNTSFYFKECLTYSAITSGKYSLRYLNKSIFGGGGDAIHPIDDANLYYILALLNTTVAQNYLRIISPTLNFEVDHIKSIPIIFDKRTDIYSIAQYCSDISKLDWDAHETSWDFKQNELVALNEDTYVDTMYAMYEGTDVQLSIAAPQDESLQWRLELYKEKWEDKFNRLHSNEEELNRQFIEIYGLQDDLTPEVSMEEVTILQQGEISIKDNELVWHDDVIIKQLISYAIGCMMGRYRLDRDGLWIAHPNPTDEEVCTYDYKGRSFTIDDDGIMPLMSRDCGFEDNGVLRFTEFLRVAFGEKYLTENLNFVEKCLGKTIEDYLKKDFWKDHKKMYQNRPIYWLFSSKKGAFQVLAYMHRMNPYTVEQIRNKYLLPHIEYLNGRITEMELKEATLSTSERKALSKLKESLAECQEYHERLHLVADQQIGFDLDDGVVVNYAKFGDVVSKIK